MTPSLRLSSLALALLLAGCATVTPHSPPAIEAMPAAFKEAGATWAPAAPADALDRGPWWELFNDPELNRLASEVQLSNQNIAAAVAAYAQAQAVVRQQRAGLLPSVSLSGSATRTGGVRMRVAPSSSCNSRVAHAA